MTKCVTSATSERCGTRTGRQSVGIAASASPFVAVLFKAALIPEMKLCGVHGSVMHVREHRAPAVILLACDHRDVAYTLQQTQCVQYLESIP